MPVYTTFGTSHAQHFNEIHINFIQQWAQLYINKVQPFLLLYIHYPMYTCCTLYSSALNCKSQENLIKPNDVVLMSKTAVSINKVNNDDNKGKWRK